MSRVDRFTERLVGYRARGWCSFKPFVIGASGYIEYSAKDLDRIDRRLGLDERILLYFWPAK